MILPDWINKEDWEGWLEMRKTVLKKPATERAKSMAIRKLEDMRREGYDPNAALREAEFRNWSGLFPTGEPKRTEQPRGDYAKRVHLSADDKAFYEQMGWKQ